MAYFFNVAESKTEERPGRVVLHETMARQTPSYAGVTFPNVHMLSDSDKLNYLIDKMDVVESLTHQIQRNNNAVDQMSTQMTVMADRATRAEFRMIDLEDQSRRNNLIFINLPEP